MAETKKSLRPKARPKGLGLSSTRPRSRPLSDEEGMAKQEAAAVKQAQSLDQVREFGNLEFRADMDKQLKWNPLARLGFEPDQSVVARPAYNSPEMYEGMRYPYRAEQEYIDDTLSRATSGSVYADIAGRVKPGFVIVNSNTAKNPIWSHEYTHGGLEKIIEYLNEDKEYFKEKYGTDTVKLLEKIEVDTNTEKGPNEKLTEMLDDISKDADVDISGNVIPAAGTGLGTMDKTRSAVSDHEASTDRVQLRRNLEEGRVNDADMSTRVFFEQNLPGYAGIFKAAEDMLEKQGEPLPSKKRGWGEQKANKWLSGEGFFNEGGDVATQTEEALGWTAEGKKFAEANPVNIKAPEGLSIKNVPAFDRPMSAGPKDKWTGRQDELGNREYKSQLDGSTYFIKPDADQRTELEKIQQDIIPAVTKYLENPTAPSKEQTIEFLKTAAGDAWETISIPGDLVSGDKTLGDITLGDVFEIGGSAAVASLPMSVPEGSMRTFGGSNPPTYEPRSEPLDSYSGDGLSQENLDLFNTNFIMFREPIIKFAETVDIPKKGLLGSEFLTLIKKNNSIPETSLQEGIIEPKKRYTKNELLEAIGPEEYRSGTFKSVANIAPDKPKQFEAFQRQGRDAGFEGGRELQYFDIPIDTSIGFPGKKFKANEQHYNSDTLVHVRGSIINPQDGGFENTDFLKVIGGEDYLLVEEIQSDLLTKGFVRPKNKFDADFSNATDDFSRFKMVSYGEAFGSIDKEIKSVVKELEIDVGKKTTDLIYSILDRPFSRTHTPKETTALLNYHELIQKKLTDKKIDNEIGTLELDSIYQAYLTNKKISDTYSNPNDIGLPPIRKNKQAVDEALKILIAKAAQSDVTKIVIPPAERIALARGRKLQEEKGDRFYRTYVTDLQKSLSELQDNYPVKIYREELPYKRHEDFVGFVSEEIVDEPGFEKTRVNTSTSKIGTIIDITELVDKYKVEKPRQFAQGGVVEDMNRQMEMFAVGGLSDDGMTRDPVSGNDIPPGSMAEEVRDDIPAQLSEGEYVVPADVVRFFGVKYFEDLRMEAKMGLSNMEANGRIGGEPVPSGGPMAGPTEGALTPEEMAVLSDMGMNVGGFVPQQPPVQAIGNAQQGMDRGYAPGGQVVPMPGPTESLSTEAAVVAPTYNQPPSFNTEDYGLGFSVFGQPSSTATTPGKFTTVTLYGPNKEVMTLTLPTQQAEYDGLISEGYTTQPPGTVANIEKDNSPPIIPTNSDTGKGGKKFSEMDVAEITEAYNDNLKARTVLTGMSLVNPIFGSIGVAVTNYAQKQIITQMNKLEVKVPEDKGFLSNLGGTIKDIFGTGDKDPKKSAVSTSTETAPAISLRPKPRPPVLEESDDGKPADFGGTVEAAEISAAAKASKTPENLQKVKAKSEAAYKAATSTKKELDSTYGSGLNKGGLMKKKKKKK